MFVEVAEGVRLHVQDRGAGHPVVLVAGFGLDHGIWDRQVTVLTRQGYRVVCVDQRGHGRSDSPLDGYDRRRLIDDLGEVLDRLSLDGCTLVGHSFAGQVAFGLAARTTGLVSRLVLVSSNGVAAARGDRFPFGRPADQILPSLLRAELANRVSSRRAAIASAFASEPDDHTVDWLLRTSLLMPSWSALACFESLFGPDQVDDLPRVRVPVLQVYGTADPVLSRKGAAWLQERLWRSRLSEIEGCGHYPMLEAPSEFEERLLHFLREPV